MTCQVVVFTGKGCHLCEAAIEVIEHVRREMGFRLEIVDIASDPAIEARYRPDIPVVEIDGRRAFRYFVQADRLRELVGLGAV